MLSVIAFTSLASAWLTALFTTGKAMSLPQAMHALGIGWFSVYIITYIVIAMQQHLPKHHLRKWLELDKKLFSFVLIQLPLALVGFGMDQM